MTYRFFTPSPARTATGLLADVHRQMREEYHGPMPTFQALSPAPELLAATWTLTRAARLAGDTDRAGREVVAFAVSRANRCRFCAAVHVSELHTLGEHDLAETIAAGGTPPDPWHAGLMAWASASRKPRAGWWIGQYRPEIVGTLLTVHFVNRVVRALLVPGLLPGGRPGGRSPGGRAAAPIGGDAVGPAAAYAALRAAAARGGDQLSELARDTVRGTVGWESGQHPEEPAAWATDLVRDLPPADRVGARIALLAAFAPAAISRGDVGLWRLSRPADADLVRLVAYGAITATDHVAGALAPARH
ncbi:carboxymuconolactone decarboxylase family protein [Paractinoplanes ferrugineus]|uniref:Alkyl hydroperoxide reductase AhpD n=1 Tax=Paractinoplanes ferrugineus TaxID=113564 RepID=A0A919J101_9ACTN|nr:carboxymuconolactone decarboxylase family protein [Actinoplanes ferrugineus]GIE11392.1 alkyl hydroperoxide reductase AhpD [Actinoplanes ferrugineus]